MSVNHLSRSHLAVSMNARHKTRQNRASHGQHLICLRLELQKRAVEKEDANAAIAEASELPDAGFHVFARHLWTWTCPSKACWPLTWVISKHTRCLLHRANVTRLLRVHSILPSSRQLWQMALQVVPVPVPHCTPLPALRVTSSHSPRAAAQPLERHRASLTSDCA